MNMFPVARVPPVAIALVIAFSLWKGVRIVWRYAYKSPLRHLRGPKGSSLLLGNLVETTNDEKGELMEKWVMEYGDTFRFKGFLNNNWLLTVDTRAVNHILTHPIDYPKPWAANQTLAEIFGEGLLLAEGTQHRQQRRIMNPAFGPAQIRALTDTFLAKAFRLRDLWSSEIAKDSTATIKGTRIDVVAWLNRVTLDIIGLTGFNYNFDTLDPGPERPDKLGKALETVFAATQNISVFNILRVLIPILRVIPTAEARRVEAAKRTMMQVGQELLADAKAVALAGETEKKEIERNNLGGRDFLSLLAKANMSTDIPESQRLSDNDVVAQVPTFVVAGHESTSTGIAWALYALTQSPEAQKKLRDELLSVDTDTPSMDELMALPYLDAVAKETLRFHAPIPRITRTAMKDNVLPVEKPYVDRYGVVRDTIEIGKGDDIVIPILTINQSKELWGPDAHEFKPERWNDVPEAVSRIPGVWSHLLTFGTGPRTCIGYRFAIVELKAVLFSLVRAFEFELAVPASEVSSRTVISQRPVLRGDPTYQGQLPMLIRPYKRL